MGRGRGAAPEITLNARVHIQTKKFRSHKKLFKKEEKKRKEEKLDKAMCNMQMFGIDAFYGA